MNTWSNYTERLSPLNNQPLNDTPNKPRVIVTIKVDPKKEHKKGSPIYDLVMETVMDIRDFEDYQALL